MLVCLRWLCWAGDCSVLGWCLQVPNWSKDDLQDILSDALSQAWTPVQEAVLSSETGMESVIDAVVRVSAQVLLLTLLPLTSTWRHCCWRWPGHLHCGWHWHWHWH